MATAQTANPEHVFEIRPVTRVGGAPTSRPFVPTAGFTPKDARRAFAHLQEMRCEILAGETTTTLATSAGGYNHVDFILEADGAAQEVADGRLVSGRIRHPAGELLVDRCRVVFVKGTPPEQKARGLQSGDRLRLLGIPRIDLAQVAARAQEARRSQEVLEAKLPYEIIAGAVLDADR
jgi:hypothetical protein